MSDDFAWFVAHYPELQKRYGNVFLAIKNRHILGAYPTYADGVRETKKTEELGSFIIQECNTQCEAYNCYIASMNFT